MPKPPPTSGVITRSCWTRDLEHALREEAADDRDALGGGGEGVAPVGGVPLADGRARLERGGAPGACRAAGPAPRGRRPRIAASTAAASPSAQSKATLPGASGQIAVRAGGQRALHVGGRGQRVEIDRHRGGGVDRLRGRLGDRDGDRLAHVAHPVDRERGNGRRGQRLAAAAGEGRGRGDRPEARGPRVGARSGPRGRRAGRAPGVGVHAADHRVGDRASARRRRGPGRAGPRRR